jgi:hypothetical protein
VNSQDSKVIDVFMLLSVFGGFIFSLSRGQCWDPRVVWPAITLFVAVNSERFYPQTRRTKCQKWLEVGKPRAQGRKDRLETFSLSGIFEPL